MNIIQLIRIANILAENNLSITRYHDKWDVHAYGKQGDHQVEIKGFKNALIKFIRTFGLEVVDVRSKKRA